MLNTSGLKSTYAKSNPQKVQKNFKHGLPFSCSILLTIFNAQGCVSRDFNPEGSGSGVLLVGGAAASNSQFPSVLQLPDQACTAVKIGPLHLLTAKHCVKSLKKNTSIMLQSGVDSASVKKQKTTLQEDAVLNPTADVAVLKLTSEPLALPVAKLAALAPRAGEIVTLVGYGCTDRSSTPADPGGVVTTSGALNDELRYLVGPLSRVTNSDAYYQANISSSSLSAGVALPGLCPGDSGGPLWNSQTPKQVVGINSQYNASGESRFVRVDSQASNSLQTWILNALK